MDWLAKSWKSWKCRTVGHLLKLILKGEHEVIILIFLKYCSIPLPKAQSPPDVPRDHRWSQYIIPVQGATDSPPPSSSTAETFCSVQEELQRLPATMYAFPIVPLCLPGMPSACLSVRPSPSCTQGPAKSASLLERLSSSSRFKGISFFPVF